MSEIQYELKEPFTYADRDGHSQEACFISMTAPSYKQVAFATPIKQAFAAAIKEQFAGADVDALEKKQEETPANNGSPEDSKIEAHEVMSVLFAWSGDLTKIYRNAESLFKGGAAQVDGEIKITGAILDKLSLADFEGIFGTYLANFIVPSLTDGQ